MIQIVIDDISGATLPVNVFISDIYGNNKTFIGTINESVPPSKEYTIDSPSPFVPAPVFLLILEDNNSCILTTTNVC